MRFRLLIFILLWAQSGHAQYYSDSYISNVSFFDKATPGGVPDFAIDLSQGSCGFIDQNGDGDSNDPGDIDPEPFNDTLVSVTVSNPGGTPLYVSRLYYRLPGATGRLRKWMGGLFPVSGGFVPARGQSTVSFFLFRADSGSKKTFRPAVNLEPSLGFQDLLIRLDARNSSGRLSKITVRRGLSFGNENRCS